MEHDKKDLGNGGEPLLARSTSLSPARAATDDQGADDDPPKMEHGYFDINAKHWIKIDLPPHATPGEISSLSKKEMITILKAKNYTPHELKLHELRALYVLHSNINII